MRCDDSNINLKKRTKTLLDWLIPSHQGDLSSLVQWPTFIGVLLCCGGPCRKCHGSSTSTPFQSFSLLRSLLARHSSWSQELICIVMNYEFCVLERVPVPPLVCRPSLMPLQPLLFSVLLQVSFPFLALPFLLLHFLPQLVEYFH